TPNLLALDAVVELSSRLGVRRTSIAQFVLGNRATTRDDNEIVTAIVIPKPQGRTRSTFLKLGARKYLVISIVMVAAVIEEGARGEVASARVAVGSCNAAPLRLERLESALKGAPVN